MLIAYLPLLVCIVGLILYLTSSKASQLGLVMFGAGLLVTLMTLAHHVVKFG